MAPSIWQIIIVAVLVILLFGRGKISDLMGDVAKGIKSFKKGISEDDNVADQAKNIENNAKSADSAPMTNHEKTS